MTPDLEFELYVSDATVVDGWFPLQSQDGRIYLHADTMAMKQQTLKRVVASNVYIPGTYTIRATPDNTTETVGIWCHIEDPTDREALVDYLIALFTRPNFRMMRIEEETTTLFWCQASDYQINNQREFRHAGVTLATFNVPILPGKETL